MKQARKLFVNIVVIFLLFITSWRYVNEIYKNHKILQECFENCDDNENNEIFYYWKDCNVFYLALSKSISHSVSQSQSVNHSVSQSQLVNHSVSQSVSRSII